MASISDNKSISKYFHEYEGYISTHDADRIPDSELEKVIREINN